MTRIDRRLSWRGQDGSESSDQRDGKGTWLRWFGGDTVVMDFGVGAARQEEQRQRFMDGVKVDVEMVGE